MQRHLAIFSLTAAEQILTGNKKIEVRFSKNPIAPFGVVEVGDLVLIKPSGEEIKGQFWVQKVLNFQGLDSKDWELIKTHYGKEIFLENKEIEANTFGTLIFIGRVERFLTSPFKIEKKDRRGWIVLE